MKTHQHANNRFLAPLLGIFSLLLTSSSPAAVLNWDANTNSVGAQDGSGIWTNALSWTNGTANVTWAAANDAVFGAGLDGGTYYINVAGLPNPSAQTMRFSNSGYVLTNGAPLSVTLSSTTGSTTPQIRVDAGKAATVGMNVIVESSVTTTPIYIGQNTTNSSGTLNIANGGMVRGSTSATAAQGHLFIDGDGTVVNVMTGGTLAQRGTSSGLIVGPGGVVSAVTNSLRADGGTVTVAGTTASTAGLLIGFVNAGIVTVTNGGLITLPTTGNGVYFGRFTGHGAFNLDGGTLSTPIVKQGTGGGLGVFNFNGGTLKALAASTSFMVGLNSANVKAGGAVIDDGGLAITIGQALLDGGTGGGLVKLGAGTLTLTNAGNTYTGTTVVSNGTLAVSGAVAGDATVVAGTTLTIPVGGSVAGNVTVAGTNSISGSVAGNATVQTNALLSGKGAVNGAVTVNSGGVITAGVSGVGNLTIGSLTLGASGGDVQTVNVTLSSAIVSVTGALTANGTTTINVSSAGPAPGVYNLISYSGPQITSGFSLGVKPPGSTLQYGASSIELLIPDSLKWTGATDAIWNTTTTNWQWFVAATPVNFADGVPVIFDDSLTANPDIVLNSTVAPSGVTFTNNSTSYSLSGSGSIGGAGSLTKGGANLLVIGNANGYSGGTTLLGTGLLALTNGGALGTGTLNLKSARTDNLPTVLLSGGITVTNAIAIDDTTGREGFYSTNGNNTLTGPITISGITATNHVLFQNDGAPGSLFTVSNSISGPALTGGLSLRGAANALGLVAGKVNINSGFQINGEANWTICSTSNNWTQTYLTGGTSGGNLILGASDALATNARVLWDNQTSGSLDLAGYNQTVAGLSHANPTTGSPRVGNSSTTTDSLLKINGGGYSYYGTLVDNIGAGTRKLSVELLSGTQTLTGDNTYSGTTTISGGTLNIGGGATTGSISNTASILNNGTLIYNRSDVFIFPNVFTGTGSVTVAGSVILPVSNPSAISSGTIQVSTTQLDTSRIELSGGITLTNALTFRPRVYPTSIPPHIINLSGINTLNPAADINYPGGGNAQVLQSDSGRLILTKGVATTQTAPRYVVLQGAGDGEVQGAISNNCALAKFGAGTWTLSGSSPLAGPTVVSNGTLVVNGSLTTAANAVTIAGGTLSGNGTIAGPVTVEVDGTLAPGTGVGTLTLSSNLTLLGTNVMEVSQSTNDAVVGVASLTLGGTLTIITNGPITANKVFQLFSASSYSGDFATYDLPVLPSPLGWDISLVPTSGTLSVTGAVATPNSIPLSVVRAGDVLTFSWTNAAFRLQSQTNTRAIGLWTNWSDYPGGISSPVNVTNNPAMGTVFFRLITP